MPKPIETQDHFAVLLAILIALATVMGAFVAWRAFVAGNASGDADFIGISAVLAAEETRAINALNAYESYGAYVSYRQYRDLAVRLQAERDALPEDDMLTAARLQAQIDLALTVSAIFQQRFSRQFVLRDGSYNLEGQLNTLYADQARQRNLNAAPSFAEADKQRTKSSWLQGAAIPLAVSLIFFTLAEALPKRFRLPMLIIGALLLAGGTAAFLYFDLSIV
jgi:hypothetical protein